MKIFIRLIQSTFIIAALLLSSINSQAQTADEGAQLFNANCTSCHAINEKVVGPALKGAHKKYDEAWLLKWVKNSQALVKSGDAQAVKVYNDNNQSVMTSFTNFTDVQVKSLIAYIKAESEKPATATTASVAGSTTSSTMDATSSNEGLESKINWLIIIISVLLIMIIVLVFDILAKVGDIQGKPVIDWYGINGFLLLGFLVLGMGAATWEFIVHTPLTVNAQTPASEHGVIYDSMFNITLLLTGIVFIITEGLLFWYGFKYRSNAKRKALYYPDNHKLELIWTIIPAIVLTVLVVRGLKTWSSITDRAQAENAQKIEVYGYQFAWNARYAGTDNILGPHDFRKIGVVNALGVDPNNETAKDDIVTNELHFKVGQPVVLKFRAKDVIHSAYLPHFRVQMNVVPGLPTQFTFTPTVTTAQMRVLLGKPNFDYILLCNKICGSAHYRMKMKVVVDTQDEYNKWLGTQPKLASISTPSVSDTKTLAVK